jgi:iron complex transport system substrate-binding protein
VAAAPDGAYVRSAEIDGDARLVVYADGSRIRVPLDPRRIVSTLPGLTEIVASLGALDRLVAISAHCDRPPETEGIRRISVMPLDREALAEVGADLVLIDPVLNANARAAGTPEGPVFLPLESRSLAHLRVTVELLAAVLGTPEAAGGAARFGAGLDLARIAAAPDPGAAPLSVLLIAQTQPLYVLGPGSLLDDMLRECGAVNVACDLGRPSGPFSEELVLARRPDWILALDGRLDADLLARWASLPAVAEGRVASGRADDLLRAGPRVPGALVRLADVLHGRRPPGALEAAR